VISFLVADGMIFMSIKYVETHNYSSAPDTDHGKQAFAVGMTVYHLLLTLFLLLKFPDVMSGASILHLIFGSAFIMWLQRAHYFD
jgi:hypothetical protein